MNFCPNCAGVVEFKVVEADNIPRFVCTSCNTIHYQNPKIVVGTIPVWENSVLLCQRNIQPAIGLWTLPAGYLELNETVAEGAKRETLEETGAHVTDLRPYRLYDILHIGQIYMIFLAKLSSKKYHPTPESTDVRLFRTADIPWEQIAFPVIQKVLEQFRVDEEFGLFPFRTEQVTERMQHHR